MNANYFLITTRLGLRHWTDDDLPLAIRLWSDPQVTRLVADLHPSEEKARARFDQEMRNLATHRIQYWPLFLRDTGEFVGCCGLRPYQDSVFEIESAACCQSFGARDSRWKPFKAWSEYAFGRTSARVVPLTPPSQQSRFPSLDGQARLVHFATTSCAETGLNHQSYLHCRWMRTLSRDASRQDRSSAPKIQSSPDARSLIEKLDALQCSLYPPREPALGIPADELRRPAATFLVACINGERWSAAVLTVNRGDFAELKRMFVLPARKGRGIGRRILAMLEARSCVTSAFAGSCWRRGFPSRKRSACMSERDFVAAGPTEGTSRMR